MLINLNQKFVDLGGRIVKNIQILGKDENGVDKVKETELTLFRIISLALLEPVIKISDDDKVKYFELCLRFVGARKVGTIDLTVEDISLIKAAIKPKFGVLIVGECMRMLEGKEIGIDMVEEIMPKSVEIERQCR